METMKEIKDQLRKAIEDQQEFLRDTMFMINVNNVLLTIACKADWIHEYYNVYFAGGALIIDYKGFGSIVINARKEIYTLIDIKGNTIHTFLLSIQSLKYYLIIYEDTKGTTDYLNSVINNTVIKYLFETDIMFKEAQEESRRCTELLLMN